MLMYMDNFVSSDKLTHCVDKDLRNLGTEDALLKLWVIVNDQQNTANLDWIYSGNLAEDIEMYFMCNF